MIRTMEKARAVVSSTNRGNTTMVEMNKVDDEDDTR